MVVYTIASREESPGFECTPPPPQSKDTGGVRLIGDSKLAVGVNMSANGCLSLCVSPVTKWRPVRLSSHDS